MKLVSRESVKGLAEIPTATTSFDALIDSIIEYYSQFFENYMNRKLEKAERTEKYNGGKRIYFVKAPPIDLAQALTVNVDGSAQTKDTDYWVDEEDGEIEFFYTIPNVKPKIVEITYTGGYPNETVGSETLVKVPDDLRGACKLQSAYLFRRRRELGVTAIGMQGVSINIEKPANLLPEVEMVLKKYKLSAGTQ